jgi:hypothetical protein
MAIGRWFCLGLPVRSGEGNQSSGRTLLAIFSVALAGTIGGGGFLSVTAATAQSSVDLLAGGDLRIDGATAQEQSSYRAAPLGDVNGDGRSDVVLGAPWADANGRQDSGSAYVVFGQATRGTVDLAALTGKGFRINGAAASDLAGTAVAGLGDVNGDGKGDLAIGAPTQGGSSSVYVVFGGRTSGAIDLANLGTEGFRIVGLNWGGKVVGGVSAEQLRLKETGDMNGDGRADIVVSDWNSAAVVFGKSSTTTVDLANLGSGGFRITGMQMATSHPYCDGGVQYCIPVARLSDVNADGAADVLVGDILANNTGRFRSGSAYVIYGKASNTTVNITALGSSGYRIDGAAVDDELGTWVASAGDVNGDGRDDLLLGARTKKYVIFTKANLTSAPIDLALAFDGYRIDGAGYPVAGTGDVNGDDLPDALIGAPNATFGTRNQSGRAYLVFGKKSFSTVFLQNLDTATGYPINGAAAADSAGDAVAGTGDINGGGKADLIVGAPNADNNGRSASGSGWILYGSGPDNRPIVTLSGKLKERENKGLYDATYDLRVVAQDGTQQQPQSGVKSIEILVDGVRRDYAEQACPNGNCSMTRDFTFLSDSYPDGERTIKVVVKDQRGYSSESIWKVTVDRRGDIYQASEHAESQAAQVAADWGALDLSRARRETETYIKTRSDSEVRMHTRNTDSDPNDEESYWVRKGNGNSDPNLEPVAGILTLRNETDTSAWTVVETGALTSALQQWQTPPPAHGLNYERKRATSEGLTLDVWRDQTTRLPVKQTARDASTGVLQFTRYWSYAIDRKTNAEVPSGFFKVARPAQTGYEEQEDWSYSGGTGVTDTETGQSFNARYLGADIPLTSGTLCLARSFVHRSWLTGDSATGIAEDPPLDPAENGYPGRTAPSTGVDSYYLPLPSGATCSALQPQALETPPLLVWTMAAASSEASAWTAAYQREGTYVQLHPDDDDFPYSGVTPVLVEGQATEAYVLGDDVEGLTSFLLRVSNVTVIVRGPFPKSEVSNVAARLRIF